MIRGRPDVAASPKASPAAGGTVMAWRRLSTGVRHGKVEPLDATAGVPVCSATLVRTIEGEARAEPCAQPLTAYFE
jgi:hypothetical protein